MGSKITLFLFLIIFLFPSRIFAQNTCISPPISQSTLSESAQRKNINIGAFFSECLWDPITYQPPSDAAVCKQTVEHEYSGQYMPFEYDWVSTEPSRGTYDFRAFDMAAAFARNTGTKIHFFHLVWNPQIQVYPVWLFPSPSSCGNWTRDQLLPMMKNYIQTTIGHGDDVVAVWNVVNEAFIDSGLYQGNCFYKIIGSDYIDQAFKIAKQANPKGLLVLSDYFGNGGFGSISRTKIDNFIEFVRNARDRGVPVEAVGIQNHLLSTDGYAFTSQYIADLEYFLTKAQVISVPVLITEMDVYQSSHSQEEVASVYKKTLAICLKYANCIALETFGISDKYSAALSVPNLSDAKPLLFNNSYQKKPAYTALMDALREDVYRSCKINPSDLNADGKVDLFDYNILVSKFGNPYTIFDYNLLISNYGK